MSAVRRAAARPRRRIRLAQGVQASSGRLPPPADGHGGGGLYAAGKCGDLPALQEQLVAAWEQASRPTRLATVQRLQELSASWVHRFLFARLHDSDYAVRWTVAEAIIAGGEQTYQTLGRDLKEAVAYAAETPASQWRGAPPQTFAMVAMFLPASARTAASGKAGAEVRQLAERMVAIGAARQLPGGGRGRRSPKDSDSTPCSFRKRLSIPARELLGVVRFWYAKIVLLHAICRRCVDKPASHDQALALFGRVSGDPRAHPLVRAAATLCARAIRERRWKPYIWHDESTVIVRSKSSLGPEATTLVADVVILLNLIEQPHISDRERLQIDPGLPFCLSDSRDRFEFRIGCHQACRFHEAHVCPYPDQANATARGNFSEGFCRQQALMMQHRRNRPAWQRIGAAAARRFWEEMADDAGA